MNTQIIESFVLGKEGKEALCEDLIVQTASYYAVIDGVTSKSDRLFDGKKGGRYGAECAAKAIVQLSGEETAEEAFSQIDRVFADVNADVHDAADRVQACAVIYSRRRNEIWNYGDCSLMINEDAFYHTKKVDTMLAGLRRFVIEAWRKQGGSEQDLYENDIGRAAILPFLKWQLLFSNDTGEFGYPVLDGSGIRAEHLRIYPVNPGDHVVLASDGYPKLFSSLAESEAYLQEILQKDPLAYRRNPQTKMIVKGALSYDDRAYLRFVIGEETE